MTNLFLLKPSVLLLEISRGALAIERVQSEDCIPRRAVLGHTFDQVTFLLT